MGLGRPLFPLHGAQLLLLPLLAFPTPFEDPPTMLEWSSSKNSPQWQSMMGLQWKGMQHKCLSDAQTFERLGSVAVITILEAEDCCHLSAMQWRKTVRY